MNISIWVMSVRQSGLLNNEDSSSHDPTLLHNIFKLHLFISKMRDCSSRSYCVLKQGSKERYNWKWNKIAVTNKLDKTGGFKLQYRELRSLGRLLCSSSWKQNTSRFRRSQSYKDPMLWSIQWYPLSDHSKHELTHTLYLQRKAIRCGLRFLKTQS